MSTTSNEKSYFDLHTSGIGYIQRVREVPVRGGRRAQPFLACTIAALVGSAKDPSYRYFDVKVSGAEAKKLVERCIGVDDPKQRPLVRFRLGDLWTDLFRYSRGDKAGKTGVSLKARLLFISWIKVDGQLVYQARPKAELEAGATSQAANAPGTA